MILLSPCSSACSLACSSYELIERARDLRSGFSCSAATAAARNLDSTLLFAAGTTTTTTRLIFANQQAKSRISRKIGPNRTSFFRIYRQRGFQAGAGAAIACRLRVSTSRKFAGIGYARLIFHRCSLAARSWAFNS